MDTRMTVGKMREFLNDPSLSDDTVVLVQTSPKRWVLEPLGQYGLVHCHVSPVEPNSLSIDTIDPHQYDDDSAQTAVVITI